MENLDIATQTLAEINIGTLVKTEWTTYLNKIKLLGKGAFGSVYLAVNPFNGKQYVVKEDFTQDIPEKTQ